MSMKSIVADTPYYVLLDGSRRIGPTVVPVDLAIGCTPIYGFSAKSAYDRFRKSSQPGLTPYPLVGDFLRSEIGNAGDGLNLVVVDAAGPREPDVVAAIMKTVLDAQANRSTRVSAAYRLVLDPQTSAYRLEEAPEEPTNMHDRASAVAGKFAERAAQALDT